MKRRRIRHPSRIAKASLREAGRAKACREYTASSHARGTTVMHQPATTHVGPLGSTIHVLRADAGTIAELAAIDWNRCFRRVCLDPVRGVIALMAPSNLHQDLTKIFDDIVDAAGSTLAGASKGLRSPRLRGRGEPPGTGMEPDCAFYVGKRARGYLAALTEGGGSGGRSLHRAHRARSGGRGRNHERRRGQGRALRGDGGTGAVAAARPQGHEGVAGGVPRPESRERAAQSRRLGSPPGAHAGRRMRCGGRGAAQSNPWWAHGGGGPDRAPPATRQRAGARGASAVSRASLPGGERRDAWMSKPASQDADDSGDADVDAARRVRPGPTRKDVLQEAPRLHARTLTMIGDEYTTRIRAIAYEMWRKSMLDWMNRINKISFYYLCSSGK